MEIAKIFMVLFNAGYFVFESWRLLPQTSDVMLRLQGIHAVLGILSLCACLFLITLVHCAGLYLSVV
jgi:hypothetical protein